MPTFNSYQRYCGFVKTDLVFMEKEFTGHVVILNPLIWNNSMEITENELKVNRVDRANKIGKILQKLYPPHTIMVVPWNSYSIIVRYVNMLKSETLSDKLFKNYPDLENEICEVKFYENETWEDMKNDILDVIKVFCSLVDENIESDSDEYRSKKITEKIAAKKLSGTKRKSLLPTGPVVPMIDDTDDPSGIEFANTPIDQFPTPNYCPIENCNNCDISKKSVKSNENAQLECDEISDADEEENINFREKTTKYYTLEDIKAELGETMGKNKKNRKKKFEGKNTPENYENDKEMRADYTHPDTSE